MARSALEFLSRKPTLGAQDHEQSVMPKGTYDLPLFLKEDNTAVRDADPVAIKRHKIYPHDDVMKLIYIERDPVEAILSHVVGTNLSLDVVPREVVNV